MCVQAQSPAELMAKADQLGDRSDWRNAAPLYAKAAAEFHRTGDARNELYAKLGLLHRDLEDGSYKAVRAEVLRLLANPLSQSDPLLQIRSLSLLGNIDLNTNTAAAGEDWNKVLAIAKGIGDQKWENRAKGELGLVAGVSGDIGSAALALYGAISKAEQLGDVSAHINFATWLANGMAVHGMADQASRLVDKASDLARKSGYTEIPLQLSIAKIRALANLSEPQREQNRALSKKLISAALAEAENQHVLGAQTELLIEAGEISASRNEFSAAENYFRQATQVSKTAALPRQEGEACLRLSQFYRSTNQPARASPVIAQGIQAVRRVEEGYDLPVFVAEKAEVQAALGLVQAADVSFQQATDLVEGLLVNAPSSQVKSGMIGALGQIYLGHFRLAWNGMHDGPYAFSIIEGARGRALLDSIRYARQSTSANAQQTRGEVEIARLQRSLMHDPLTNSQIRHMLDQLDEAYMQLSPVEYARQRKEMGLVRRHPASVADLQAQLRQGEAIVEYVMDEKASYAIEISRAGLKIHNLPARTEISNLSRTFVTAIRNGTDSQSSGRELYKQLIGPVRGQNISSLIIVPDGPLHLIPFGALVNDAGGYLNSELSLSAAPSATIYYTLSRTPRAVVARKPFLGVAFSPPSQSSKGLGSTTRAVTDLRAGSLKPLQFSHEEITEAAKVFGPESVTLDGSQASEEALKAEPLADFKVIHLAAHGVSDELDSDRTALVFAPGSESEDGLWQAREIRRTRLNADVVVLSACETGSGKLQGQEGVMNLARAFLTAGARSVVASLWDVDDRSTATLMESFYEHLKAGLTVKEALRQAQLDFIKNYGDKAKPNLWAGFEVIGDGTKRFTFEKTNARSTH
ncbi:MAG TPA: CHAT domain-containing protein [Bryobacteraceae bacterium]|nr:CHAT domain-containing protein [Bryobacteraceae bacterium]